MPETGKGNNRHIQQGALLVTGTLTLLPIHGLDIKPSIRGDDSMGKRHRDFKVKVAVGMELQL